MHERTVDANTSKPKDPVSPSAATVLPKRAKSGGRTHGARAVLSAIDIDQSSQVTPLMIPAPPTRRTRARDDLPSIPIVMTQQAAIQRDRLPSDVAQESISVALGKRGSRHRMKLGEEPPPKKAKIISGIPLVEVNAFPVVMLPPYLMNVGSSRSRILGTPYKGCSTTEGGSRSAYSSVFKYKTCQACGSEATPITITSSATSSSTELRFLSC